MRAIVLLEDTTFAGEVLRDGGSLVEMKGKCRNVDWG